MMASLLSHRLQLIGQKIDYVISVQPLRGERGIWQRRYWEHRIRDDQDFEPLLGAPAGAV